MSEVRTKEEYYQVIKAIKERLATDECSACPCPKTHCDWHGDCCTCVRQHRMNGTHLPVCLQPILNEKIGAIAEVAEMTVTKKPDTPPDYWDYVRQREKEEKSKGS